jgi:predicted PurR-regulated permease PerM
MPWRLLRRSSEKIDQPAIRSAGPVEPRPLPPIQSSAWTSDKQLSLLVLIGLTFAAAYLTYIIFRPFLTALFIAIIMALTSDPLHKWVSRKIRNRTLAALTTTALVIFAVLIPITVVGAKITIEAIGNYRSVLNQLSNTATWPERLDPLIEEAAEQTGLPPAQLKAEIVRRARDWGARLIAGAGTIAQRFGQQMLVLLLGAIFLFPLIRSSDELRVGALDALPLPRERTRELAVAISQGVIANIYGMLAVGVCEGILIAIGFRLVGLSSPLMWGAVATVLSFLPVVGVSLVWISGCIFLSLHEQWLSAILLGLWGLIVVSAADGIVRGRVISGRVKTNSLVVTLSLMGGLAVFGPIGFFVGPVTVVVLASLLRILREEHAAAHGARNPAA